MSNPAPEIILDEPCARLRDAVAQFAPVFVFKPKGKKLEQQGVLPKE